MTSERKLETSSTKAGSSLILRLPWIRLVAEFLVIFVGITLSLIADDWRQSRRDLEAERRALSELLIDLEADAESLEQLQATMVMHDRAAMWLYRSIGQSEVAVDSLMVRLKRMHGLNLFKAQRATYAALLSTGELGVVGDEVLRRAIARYYEDLQPQADGFFQVYFDAWYDWRRMVGPDYIWVYEDGVDVFGSGGSAGVLRRDWADISSDPNFGYLLRETGILANVTSDRATAALEQHEVLVEAIQARLARR